MSLEDLITGTAADVADALRTIGWAEDEIGAAQTRHPQAAERIWHSFLLLAPAVSLPWTELVYRSHCRELLERVAQGQDTRPATAAECCLVLSHISLQAPLSTSAVGLYARLWHQAGLPPEALSDAGAAYEALHSDRIDNSERQLREYLRQNWRTEPASPPAAARPAAQPEP